MYRVSPELKISTAAFLQHYLISQSVALLGGILKLLDGGVQAVCLPLQALHLLADGVHVGGGLSEIYIYYS